MRTTYFVVVLAMAVAQANKISKCTDMPKVENVNVSEVLRKHSLSWNIYISTKPATDSCLKCGYNITSYKPVIVATVILFNIMKNVRVNLTVSTHSKFNGWHVVGSKPSPVEFFIAAFDANIPYLCVYTCDPNGVKVDNFMGLSTNEEGFNKMNDYLKNKIPNWPFKDTEKPVRVYTDSCRTSGVPSFVPPKK